MRRTLPEGTAKLPLDGITRRGMKPKKQHEVSHMAEVIQDVCVKAGCHTVLDVGAGLVGTTVLFLWGGLYLTKLNAAHWSYCIHR